MQLHDFFTTANRAVPAPTRKISLRLLGSNAESAERLVADATAELAFVSDADRLEALRECDAHIQKIYKGVEPPSFRRFNEEVYFILLRALRDPEDVNKPFARTPLELRNALVLVEALRAYDEHVRFMAEEFPPAISPAEERELVEEAKKNSLLALLSSRGSDPIRAAWPALVLAASGDSLMPMSSDGAATSSQPGS